MVKGMKLNVRTSGNFPDQFKQAMNSGIGFLISED